MINVKPIDNTKLDSWMSDLNTAEYQYKSLYHGGVVETPAGPVLVETDGCHMLPALPDEKAEFGFYKEHLKDGKVTAFDCMPSMIGKLFFNELPLLPEVPLKTFVGRGRRKDENYHMLLQTLRGAGLDVTGLDRD